MITKKITKNEKKVIQYAIEIVIAIVFILSIFKIGLLGVLINNINTLVFGDFYLVYFAIIFLFIIKKHIFHNRRKLRFTVFLSIMFLCLGLLFANVIYYVKVPGNTIDYSGFNAMKGIFSNLFKDDSIFYGGIIGVFLYSSFHIILGDLGSKIVCILFFALTIFVLIPVDTYKKIYKFLYNFFHSARLGIKEMIMNNNGTKNVPVNDKTKSEVADLDVMPEQTEEIPTPQVEIVQTESQEIKEIEREETNNDDEDVPEIITSEKKPKKANPYAHYVLPTMKLLEGAVAFKSDKNQLNASQKGKKLVEVLKTFGIRTTLVNTHIGPSVTKFEIKPDTTVNLNKIINLTDNIKMELAAKEVRIEAPIPGRNAVGVEIPNFENVPVKLSELLVNAPKNPNPLMFALGKDLLGQAVFCEINKMPHLLIGGQTGSGKSVCINTIICSILMRARPDEVKLILIDPKRVEFTPYKDVPHLLWPVITDAKMASNLLVKLVTIMKDRFDLFSEVGVRDISTYNQKVIENNKTNEDKMEKLPYIVTIIDELADLMLIAGKEVEGSIQRLTQLARASGIHLIVATQRPSADVITGLIKSNIPSRIAFQVQSAVNSRIILDQSGAERLLGKGDGLYFPQSESSPVRIQGCMLSDKEIQTLTSYVKKYEPQYDDTYFELERIKDEYNSSNDTDGGDDSLYDEAVEHIRKTQKASTSSLQRRFGIGYNRAARIIDTLEARGIIGPANGSKPREVYIKKESEGK